MQINKQDPFCQYSNKFNCKDSNKGSWLVKVVYENKNMLKHVKIIFSNNLIDSIAKIQTN